MGYNKVPSFAKIEAEYDALSKEKAKYEKDYKSDKARIAELSSVKKKVEQFLEKDVQRNKTKTKEELD